MNREGRDELQHISKHTREIERNIELATKDPVLLGGFTQVPNFILKQETLSVGAKVIYAMFLHYAWDNSFCFPGQQRLAADIGMSVGRVNDFIKELEKAGLIDVRKRGQGRTNLYKINFRVRQGRVRGG